MSIISYAQVNTETENPEFPQDIEKKHELKINALSLLVTKWIDVSYENLINEESSFGVAATLNTDTSYSDLKYSLTPYYRRYFSNKFARGFLWKGLECYSQQKTLISLVSEAKSLKRVLQWVFL